MEKKESRELNDFLKKVDDVTTIITEMNAGDEKAVSKADTFLGNIKSKQEKNASNGFSKTHINKVQHKLHSETRAEISPEEFMKEVEEDSEFRKLRRKENKEKALVWKEKGNVHFKNTSFVDSLECYTQAIKLAPDQVLLYSNRAQAYIKMYKFVDALNDCDTGLKLNKELLKLHVHRGRALLGLKRFHDAEDAFNKILRIDKKRSKLVAGYMKEVERERELHQNEEHLKEIMNEENGNNSYVDTLDKIKYFVGRLRKGSPPDISSGGKLLGELKDLLIDIESRTLFRTSGGFQIFTEHPAFRMFVSQEIFSLEDCKTVTTILLLLSNAMEDVEENTFIASKLSNLFNASIQCVRVEQHWNIQFQGIQFFHRLTQYERPRKNVLLNVSISRQLLDESLAILRRGGDLALIAMGVINNLALDGKFVPYFKEKLSSDFIPGVTKMMELLTLSPPQSSVTKTFHPVMATSISTIGNMFINTELRKDKAANDETLWSVSHQLLAFYSQHLKDDGVLKVVEATLGMLMNLSTVPVVINASFAGKWVALSALLLRCTSYTKVVEYCSGVLNHTLDMNEVLLKEVMEKKLYVDFIDVVKSNNAGARRYILKCLAVCGKATNNSAVHEQIHTKNATSSLLNCLQSEDERIVGNTALIFSQMHLNKDIVKVVTKQGLIKKLLKHATDDSMSATVRHNCAIAIGKYCLADPNCLQQLRDLHGLEILHEVMKENKLV